jgi:hypothetical protein
MANNPSTYKSKDRVRALAELFDKDTEDEHGRTYSQKRSAQGLGRYCLGTITRVYYRRGLAEQKYQVKWDEGTSTSLLEQHLLPVDEGTDNLVGGDDETSGMSQHLTRDGESTDEGEDDIETETQGEILPDPGAVITAIGATVQCGEYRWRRVKSIPADTRAAHPEFEFSTRNVTITETTSLNEILWMCMPCPRKELLDIVRYRAGPFALLLTLTFT